MCRGVWGVVGAEARAGGWGHIVQGLGIWHLGSPVSCGAGHGETTDNIQARTRWKIEDADAFRGQAVT